MLLELLQKRYSLRDFSVDKIPAGIVDYMLQCARLSASGGNEQPWKFGVITDPSLIKGIAEAASVNYNQGWIARAPLIIVLCTQLFEATRHDDIGMNRFPSIHDELQKVDRDLYARVNMEEHQTKIPGEHMVLAALEHGVYSTWISSIDCEKVGELIGVKGYLVTNAIAFGYPQKSRNVTPKKDLSAITFTDHFDNAGFTP